MGERFILIAALTACLSPISASQRDGTSNVYLAGGVFEPGFDHVGNAFVSAFDNVNDMLTAGSLTPEVLKIPSADSYQASKKVCSLLSKGALAIFGPQSQSPASHVQSIAAAMQVPHLEARIDFNPSQSSRSINLMPSASSLMRPLRDLVRISEWHNRLFAIIVSGEKPFLSQVLLEDNVLRSHVSLLLHATGSNNKDILNQIKAKHIVNIILDLPIDGFNVSQFVRDADEMGMMEDYYMYISTSLDLEQAEIPDVHAAIYSLSLIQNSGTGASAQAALTHDAVQLFTESLRELMKTKPLERHNLSCGREEAWSYGKEIRDQMIKTRITGMTGEVTLDSNGTRSDFKLWVLRNVGENGQMMRGATWTLSERFKNLKMNHTRTVDASMLRGQKLVVLMNETVIYPLEGYLTDVLDLLQEEFGFNYTIERYLSSDNEINDVGYGWMGRLQRGSADIALPTAYADLSLSEAEKKQQEERVAITAPVLESGTVVAISMFHMGSMTKVEDLLDQNSVAYGAIENSLVDHHLRNSNNSKLREMRDRMESSCPRWFVKTYDAGMDRTKAGGFAFFGPKTLQEFHIMNNCDLRQLGDMIDGSGYGIRMQKTSPYTSLFSNAILKLRESGKLRELKMKHFKKVQC